MGLYKVISKRVKDLSNQTNYPKLSDIVKDRYKFIFVDEYQDTNKYVIEIFLEYFKVSPRKNTIGFFGDAMQSIYDDTIGNLDAYKGVEPGKVKEVKKSQNRRNPQSVIRLANLLRTDGIVQIPSYDLTAPNMVDGLIKSGKVLFLHSINNDINHVKKTLEDRFGWSFGDAKKTKELNLTHNLIATKAGFRTLMDIYDKDSILDFKSRIKKYIKDKNIATDFSNMTFGQVIESLQRGKSGRDLSAVSPTLGMQNFINDNPDLYTQALLYDYSVFSKIYVNSDQLIDDKKQDENDENKKGSKRDNLVRHLFRIETNISLYQNGMFNEFLQKTDYRHRIKKISDKKVLKENIEQLINVGDKTIEEIIIQADETGITLIDDRLKDFKAKQEYLYNRVKDVKYSEFQNLFQYLEGKTPFSTQHKTKGAEFDNVLVVLDNGGWNKYNFENLFLSTGTQTVLERTQKIFYVCCTRSKENLAVFYHTPIALNPLILNKAKDWFGEDNVYAI
jgi:DNA helicase-2/ATP-dependent DNA helicase PcrA